MLQHQVESDGFAVVNHPPPRVHHHHAVPHLHNGDHIHIREVLHQGRQEARRVRWQRQGVYRVVQKVKGLGPEMHRHLLR